MIGGVSKKLLLCRSTALHLNLRKPEYKPNAIFNPKNLKAGPPGTAYRAATNQTLRKPERKTACRMGRWLPNRGIRYSGE